MRRQSLLPLLLAALPAVAASAEPLNYNVVEFAESATATVPNDTLTVLFEVSEEGKSREEVSNIVTRRLNTLNHRIEANRKFESELLNRSVSPRYEYKNGKSTIIGWRDNANIMVKSKDFQALGKLMADSQKEASVSNLSFSVSPEKRDEVIERVSTQALTNFRKRADSISRTLGFRGYKIVRLNLNSGFNTAAASDYEPRAYKAAAMADLAASPAPEAIISSPGTQEISQTVHGSIQM